MADDRGLSDRLLKILRDDDGAMATEIHAALPGWLRRHNEPEDLEALMASQPERFRHSPPSFWYVAMDDDQLAVLDEERRAEPAPAVLASTDPSEPVVLERELVERLRDRCLVAEIGLDRDLFERVSDVLHHLWRGGRGWDQIGRNYPACLVTYLVGHGVFHYGANHYWHDLLPGVDREVVPRYREAIAGFGLEAFDELVSEENAANFVAPVLAQGGVPQFCLNDFFDLLAHGRRTTGNDPSDLMTYWRVRTSAFANIDKPVKRFLLYGGSVASDFLDRCIGMVVEFANTRVVPDPARAGLPPYVVEGFAAWIAEKPVSEIHRAGRTPPRPVVVLDPWVGLGPEVVLPSVADSFGATDWRVRYEGHSERVRCSRHSETERMLPPARTWTVELCSPVSTLRETVFDALGDIPALFFDGSDGRLFAARSGLRASTVFAVCPREVELIAIDERGVASPVEDYEGLPPLTGVWSDHVQRSLSLDGISALVVRVRNEEHRVPVRSVASSPELVGVEFGFVRTSDGDPVHSRAPILRLPAGSELSSYVVRVEFDRESVEIPEDCWTADILDLADVLPDRIGIVDLRVRGPLGSDLRRRFALVPGLSVTRPERIILPNERRGAVTVCAQGAVNEGSPGDRVTLPLPDEGDELFVDIRDARSDPITLRIQLSRLLWSAIDASSGLVGFDTSPTLLSSDDVIERAVTGLAVRLGMTGTPVRLDLRAKGEVLQATEFFEPRGDAGRWVFDLGVFTDALRHSDAPLFELVLQVGQLPVTVARIRPDFAISRLYPGFRQEVAGVEVDMTFEESRPLRDRVVRLWPTERPWEPPITRPIPDDADGAVGVTVQVGDLPVGLYLIEVAVDDGWTAPKRPDRSRSAVGRRLGSHDDVEARRAALDHAVPLNILELALTGAGIVRPLDEEELRSIGEPALIGALSLLEEPGGATSRAFRNVCSILVASPDALAGTWVDAIERGLASDAALSQLAVRLLPRLRSRSVPEIASSLVQTLWSVQPELAAVLDTRPPYTEERRSRAAEHLGWDPVDGLDSLPRNDAVGQQWIGMELGQLEAIGAMVELVPQQLLSKDNYLACQFEWLKASKAGESLPQDWRDRVHSRMRTPAGLPAAADDVLHHRRPTSGTERLAEVPWLTLVAALAYLDPSSESDWPRDALLEAMEFAPRLVRRDLVLAHLLLDPPPVHDAAPEEHATANSGTSDLDPSAIPSI